MTEHPSPIRRPARIATAAAAAACMLATTAAAQQPATAAGEQRVAVGPRTLVRVQRAAASNESFAAGPADMLEIVLSDGGSVALAPGASVILQAFAFDPATGGGEMRLSVERGDVRVMGGRLNQRTPVVITAGPAEMTLRNGGAFVSREGDAVRAALLVAGTLDVRQGAAGVKLSRPGFETVVEAGGVAPPRQQPRGQAFADAARINPGLLGAGATAGAAAVAETATVVETETLDDPNLRRPEVAGSSAAGTYAVNLPDGTAIASLNASLGLIASNGVSSSGDGAIDVVLGQDSVDYVGEQTTLPFSDTNVARRDTAPITNRILLGKADDYVVVAGSSIITSLRDSSQGPGTDELSYLVSTTLPTSALRFSSQVYAKIANVSEEEKEGKVVSVTLFAGAPNEQRFTRQGDTRTFEAESGERIFQRGSDSDPDGFYVLIDGFSRDTVFVLAKAPNLPRLTLSGDALAVPYDFVFAAPRRLQVNRLDRRLSLTLGGNFELNSLNIFNDSPAFDRPLTDDLANENPGAVIKPPTTLAGYRTFIPDTVLLPPVQASADQFDVGQSSIDMGVRGLSAGFSPAADWFVPQPPDPDIAKPFDPDNGSIPLAGNPRAVDNFVMVEAEDRQGRTITFATGDVGPGRGAGSVDSFVLSRGLNPADFTADATGGPGVLRPRDLAAAQAFRSFLPAGAGAAAASTPLMIVNPPADAAGDLTGRLFQADLALNPEGTASSISATLGTITYDSDGYGLYTPGDPALPSSTPDPRARITLKGQTVGSTARAGGSGGPTLLQGGLLASSTGGGALWNGTQERPGYAGYLVLENVVDERQKAALSGQGFSEGELADLAGGGSTTPLDGSRVDQFGLLRLATGVASTPLAPDRTGATGRYDGYVAGLHQIAGGASEGLYSGVLALALDGATNGVSAAISYARPVAGARSDGAPIAGFEPPVTLTLGDAAGTGGAGTYVGPGTFGASVRSAEGATAAIVSGEAVKSGLGSANAARIPTYAHVQWGFFLGDLLPQGGMRTHTALSTWAAGRRANIDTRIQGTASYAGHAIGTVVRQGSAADVRTVVGTFEQSWNLDARTGTMALDFDGARYGGGTGLRAAPDRPGIAYTGVIDDAATARQAKIDGELVDVSAARPQGTVGQFQIRGVDASYQANGTFAGDVR